MKNLKHFVMAILAVAQITAIAQQTECNPDPKENFGSDEPECRKCLSLYSENLKQNNNADALKYWRCAMKICPEFKPSLYTNGQIMYTRMIDEEKDEAVKEKLIDTLLWLYDEQIRIFGPCPDYLENKGAKALKYRQKNPELSYKAFREYTDSMKENSSCVAIYGEYTALYIMYRYKKVDCEEMVNQFLRLSDYLDVYEKNHPEDNNCGLARETLDKYAAGCLGCDKLIEIYTKKFESLPADKESQIKELNKMSDMLSKKECTGDLIDKIAEKMYELEPSHKAAYALAVSNVNKGKNSEALKWIKQAIEQCGDCEDIAKYYLLAAKITSGSTAISYAKTAIAKDTDGSIKCDAYVIIARNIASSPCGENDFERKWVYCLALDYLDKARAAGCTNTGGLYSSYEASCPTKQELFTYGKKEGDVVTVSCWGESTKLRAAK